MDPSKGDVRGAGEYPPSKSRVLVVDDEAGIVKLLCETLSFAGFDCRGCQSGYKALDLLACDRFDAIISDLRMPGMNGLELLRSVREKDPHMAFILATAVDDALHGVQAMKGGADEYLLKPLNLEAMTTTLKCVLEQKRLEIEAENYRDNLETMVEQQTKQLQVAERAVELTHDEAVEALDAALDLRDTETAGHSRRVVMYCMEIAGAMGCDREQQRIIARGALLHDIGKLGIPDAILLKAGALTVRERSVMQTHARIGFELLRCFPFLEKSAEIVLTHHERFDGTGYSQGLIGVEIPLGARIFAVADTLDAITSDRPYRRALSLAAAREEISRWSGKQFDPAVVSAFLRVGVPIWEAIRQEKETQHTGKSTKRRRTSQMGPKVPTGQKRSWESASSSSLPSE
jgi:putative nucleotidyltransferase with HDIG domain